MSDVQVPIPTVEAEILGWGEDEVVSTTSNSNGAQILIYEEEHQLRLDLESRLQASEENLQMCKTELLASQNRLWAYEKHLELVQKHEKKVIGDLEKANGDLARLERVEADMDFVTDALRKVGVRFLGGQGERKLVCDKEKDSRWALMHDTVSSGQNFTSTMGQPLDAIAAIDTLLDAHKEIIGNHALNTLFADLQHGRQEMMERQEVPGPSTTVPRVYYQSDEFHEHHLQHPPYLHPYPNQPANLEQWPWPHSDYSAYAQGLFEFFIPK